MVTAKDILTLRGFGYESELTPRQQGILQNIANGQTAAQIAIQEGISIETVRTHTKRIIKKMNAHTRTEAVANALRRGLIR